MTKKLNWRLKELPTANEIASLVEREVITKLEARDMLFSVVEKNDKQVEALKEQIEFMDTMITKLMNQKSFNPINLTHTPVYPIHYWRPTTFMATTGNLNSTLNTASVGGGIASSSGSVRLN